MATQCQFTDVTPWTGDWWRQKRRKGVERGRKAGSGVHQKLPKSPANRPAHYLATWRHHHPAGDRWRHRRTGTSMASRPSSQRRDVMASLSVRSGSVNCLMSCRSRSSKSAVVPPWSSSLRDDLHSASTSSVVTNNNYCSLITIFIFTAPNKRITHEHYNCPRLSKNKHLKRKLMWTRVKIDKWNKMMFCW